MTFIAEIARRCELHGVRVIRVPGCETRGNGQTWAQFPEGIIDHHTAGARNIYIDQILITGRADLPGPLCNFCITYDGDLGEIADHPANHGGASGGWDTWPLPVTTLFNRQVVGVEVQYPGTEPMSPAQWKTLCILNKVTLEVLDEIGRGVLTPAGGDPRRIKNHQGTSKTGKWDMGYAPGKTYDINHVRAEAMKVGLPAGPAPTEEEDDMTPAQAAMLDIVFDQITGPGNAERIKKGEPLVWGWETRRYLNEGEQQEKLTPVDLLRVNDREMMSRLGTDDRPSDVRETLRGDLLNIAGELRGVKDAAEDDA